MNLLKRKPLTILVGGLFFALLPIGANLGGEPYLITLFSRIIIYAIAAVSLDILLGCSGLISLGHAAYVGIGAYVIGILYYHGEEGEPLLSSPFLLPGTDNFLVALPIAVLVAALFATVLGSLCLRTKGMHFIMITLAFAQMLFYFFVSLEKYGGDDGLSLYSRNRIPGLDLGSDTTFYYLCFFFLVLFLIFSVRLARSRFGLVLQGAKNNDRRINSLGINSYWYKLGCFVIGSAGAGLAGALLANQTEYVSPGLLHWTLSGELMVMVLLGGLNSFYGPVLGATLFLLLEEGLAMYTEHWMVFMGPILILVVIFAKKGVFGLLTGEEK